MDLTSSDGLTACSSDWWGGGEGLEVRGGGIDEVRGRGRGKDLVRLK